MPTITDWLMVGITVVYVIATIFICVANIHSAKASQLQLLEMKREYEENQRITLMPYLNICKCVEAVGEQGEAACWLTKPCTKDYLDATVFFQLTNCGPGNAVDISYDYNLAKKHLDNRFIEYHMEFFKSGLTRIIQLWLQDGCKETPEEMFEIVKNEYRGREEIFAE